MRVIVSLIAFSVISLSNALPTLEQQNTGRNLIDAVVEFKPEKFSDLDLARLSQVSHGTIPPVFDVHSPMNKRLRSHVSGKSGDRIKKHLLRGQGPLMTIRKETTPRHERILLNAARYCMDAKSANRNPEQIHLVMVGRVKKSKSFTSALEQARTMCDVELTRVWERRELYLGDVPLSRYGYGAAKKLAGFGAPLRFKTRSGHK